MKSPLKPLRVVRVNPTCYDPSLAEDMPHDALRQYVLTREEKHLKFAPDGNPVWFNLNRLPQAFLTDVLDAVYPVAARRLVAFRAACHLIESNGGPVSDEETGRRLQVYSAKLAPRESQGFVATDADHGVDMAPLEYAQLVADLYGAETIQEMGQLAMDFARLPRGKAGPFGSWAGSVASG